MSAKPSQRQPGLSPNWSAVPEGRWDDPGLGEWDLRSLIGHTSRSLITVETYLGQPADVDEVPTAAAYDVAIADIDSVAVADRGRQAGQALGANPAVVRRSASRTRVLAKVDTAGNPLIQTAAGGMHLESYLLTRTFELVVHSLDIAAAVPDVEPPEFSDQLLSEVGRVAATAAVLRGPWRRAAAGAHWTCDPQPRFQHGLTATTGSKLGGCQSARMRKQKGRRGGIDERS